MWSFIALIIIVAIMFGITLHEAFWGIIGALVGLVVVVILAVTKNGRKLTKATLVLVGLAIAACGVAFLLNKDNDYKNQISFCDNKDYSTYLVTIPGGTKQIGNTSVTYGETYDYTKVVKAKQDCYDNAQKQSNDNQTKGIACLVGGLLLSFLVSVYKYDEKEGNKKTKRH